MDPTGPKATGGGGPTLTPDQKTVCSQADNAKAPARATVIAATLNLRVMDRTSAIGHSYARAWRNLRTAPAPMMPSPLGWKPGLVACYVRRKPAMDDLHAFVQLGPASTNSMPERGIRSANRASFAAVALIAAGAPSWVFELQNCVPNRSSESTHERWLHYSLCCSQPVQRLVRVRIPIWAAGTL